MTLAMKQGFAPPEQYRSRGQGTWTDVYSLCATVYYCLTGKLPVQAMDRLTGKKLPTPGELGVMLPRRQEETILQGLDLFVDKRPQTMRELWERMYASEDAVSETEDERSQTVNQTDGIGIPTVDSNKTADGNSTLLSSFEDLRNGGFREVCIAIFRKLRGLSGME